MLISVKNSQKDLKVKVACIRSIFKSLIQYKKVKVDELSVHLISDALMRKMHLEHFNDPTPTDCITFPIDDPTDQEIDYVVLGECFVCPKTAITYASENKKDPFEELTLYLVHCFLHLLGFDDIASKDRLIMRGEEKKCMDHLRNEDLILKQL